MLPVQRTRTALLGKSVPVTPKPIVCSLFVWSSSCPRCRLRIHRSRLISRLYFHVQHHPDIRHEVTVVSVRWTAWLSRVISHLGVLLVSVQRLHCGVHI